MQRQTRAMERSNTMRREKRGLDSSEGDEGQPERKRPALASVIVEALKVDSLQKLCSSLEPILRRVVSEEVERALAKLGPPKISGRSSPKRIDGPDGGSLQLQFRSRLSLPLFTGGRVEGEQGAAIHVVLVDASTERVVTSGPESSVKLDIVVLEGDFNNEDDEGWTQEEFESHVVKEREGKRPLLTGDLQVTLKEGVGTIGELTFTDNSSWIRSRKFRLGLRVASGYGEGIRIREAKTDAFNVKDHRGELYKKHYPPALNDEVWRLEKIGKDGSFHKRLNKSGIRTVEDFLRLVVRDSQRLRNILGSGMSNKMWDALVEHAKTCVLGGKHYVYHADDTRNIGVVFNNIYELIGLIAGPQYYPLDSLSESQKDYVDSLVKKAYDNWMHVIEYDGKALLGYKQNKELSVPQIKAPMSATDYSQSYDQQVSLQQQRLPPPQDHLPIGSGLTVDGYNGYSVHSQHLNSGAHMQYDTNSYAPPQNHHQLVGSTSQQNHMIRNDMVGLALGQPHSSGDFEFQTGVPPPVQTSQQQTGALPFDDWSRHRDNRGGLEEFFTEDEIRLRSHEMLENEDMQQLLRVFSMNGHGGTGEDGYGFSSYMPSPALTYNFEEDKTRSSGKAVVGWLKLKAALRWGIFIRKKAAERRAQIVELDD
ncbi:Calmodulin-binding protein 60 B [Ranunculus cassubicifolius]